MRYLIILLLTGCQITVARLPSPVEANVVDVLQKHEAAIQALIEAHNKTIKKE